MTYEVNFDDNPLDLPQLVCDFVWSLHLKGFDVKRIVNFGKKWDFYFNPEISRLDLTYLCNGAFDVEQDEYGKDCLCCFIGIYEDDIDLLLPVLEDGESLWEKNFNNKARRLYNIRWGNNNKLFHLCDKLTRLGYPTVKSSLTLEIGTITFSSKVKKRDLELLLKEFGHVVEHTGEQLSFTYCVFDFLKVNIDGLLSYLGSTDLNVIELRKSTDGKEFLYLGWGKLVWDGGVDLINAFHYFDGKYEVTKENNLILKGEHKSYLTRSLEKPVSTVVKRFAVNNIKMYTNSYDMVMNNIRIR